MAIVETLLAAKAAVGVGKGVMDWLNAKNKTFKKTPEERRAQESAGRRAALGMGGESFRTAANTLTSQSQAASSQIRANAFAAGLENSAVTRVGQAKVQNLSSNQLADLALKISDRNTQFRERAATRKENIDMAIGQRRRQFEETRKAQMRNAAFNTALSALDLGIKGAQAKEAVANKEALASQSATVNTAFTEITDDFISGNDDQAIEKIEALAELELDVIDTSKLSKTLMTFYNKMNPSKEGG
tara:strand:- start:595 stop:1329 length:735 start_codon:yes stop_codon:yes gene_type:complete